VKHFYVSFSDEILVEGSGEPFSAKGDSGSLILDSLTAEPTGLLFAGSKQVTFANPITTVLSDLGGAKIIGGTTHAVAACKGSAESEQQNLTQNQLPASEILRVLKSKNTNLDWLLNNFSVLATCVGSRQDQPKEGAIILVVRSDAQYQPIPSEIDGVATRVIYSEPIMAGNDYSCPVMK
jgi:hypothetical protein